VVLTDRVEVVLPAGVAGTLASIAVAAGSSVIPGAPLAQIQLATPAAQWPRVTPLARKLAVAHGIDPFSLVGSGPHGRVWLRDVAAVVGHERHDTGHRARVASHQSPVELSHSPIPYVLTVPECDMSDVLARCASEEANFSRWGVALDHIAFVALAALEELPHHPHLLSCWSDDGIVRRRRLHLGLAHRQSALLGVIADAGDLNLRGLARRLAQGVQMPAASIDPTFVVAPLAAGVWWNDVGRLLLGGVAALGIGAPRHQPVVRGDGLAVRPISLLTLAYDVRVMSQRQADGFLTALCRRLAGTA